jgi:uncharacterized protein YwqG
MHGRRGAEVTGSVHALTDSLSSAGLARVAAALAAASAPCIRLVPAAGSSPRRSRIGGLPHLPPSQAWPSWKGEPLSHLCQIDLSEVAHFGAARSLPDRGVFSFFYVPDQSTWGFDPADRGSWVVLYHGDSNLRPAQAPAQLAPEASFREAALEFEEALSLPSTMSDVVAQLRLTDAEFDALCGFIEAYESPAHHLLGHPQPVQDDMELECQLASNGVYCGDPSGYAGSEAERLKPGARDWRLLLQLDSDDDRGMMWGDLGRLYFWIRSSDMAACAFDRVWMILQCS